MASKMMRACAVPALVLTTAAGLAWSFQPEPPRQREGGQPGGQPGDRGGRGEGRGEGRGASVEGAMKSMGRPLKALSAQITDASKKDENLQMINDMQRGAVMAKGAKLSEKVLEKGADAKAKAEMAKEYRRHMLALTKTLLEVETLLMDDKFEEAKADLQSFFETRGTVVAAGGLEARPAVVPGAGRGGGVRGVAEGAEEGVFGGFDVAEEVREMDDAGEIGIGEFDLAAVGEMERGGRGVGHAGLGGGGRETAI